jgi:hypothetical protein
VLAAPEGPKDTARCSNSRELPVHSFNLDEGKGNKKTTPGIQYKLTADKYTLNLKSNMSVYASYVRREISYFKKLNSFLVQNVIPLHLQNKKIMLTTVWKHCTAVPYWAKLGFQ